MSGRMALELKVSPLSKPRQLQQLQQQAALSLKKSVKYNHYMDANRMNHKAARKLITITRRQKKAGTPFDLAG